MKNLFNLYRLPIGLWNIIFFISIKKILKIKYSTEERNFLNYYLSLVLLNGKCQHHTNDEFISHLTVNKENLKVLLRKSPSSDISVLGQVLGINHQYTPLINLIKKYTDGKDTLKIIDAGANIGLTTLLFKTEFPKACIACVEPDDNNYKQLNKNIELNNLLNIKTIKAGLWNSDCYLEINNDFRDGKDWSFYVKETTSITNLKGYSLETIIQELKWDVIDILKMDIEGAECVIFENEKIAEEILSKVKFFAIEIHDEFDIRDKMNKYLTKFNFDFFSSGELVIGRNKKLHESVFLENK